jgi:hypothetical protein
MEKARPDESDKTMPSSTETIPTPTQIAEDYKEISKQMQVRLKEGS